MPSKVRVNAKSQKWAALGVIDAYMKMYPHATLDDLNKAFPRSIFTESDPNLPLLVTLEEKERMAAATKTTFDDDQLVEWKNTHYYLTTNDGKDIAFTVPMWTKEMFDKMLSQAKLYDIEFAKYEAAEKGFGKRGEYSLEYLNGYVPPVPEEKKSKAWLWILLAALAVIAILVILLLMKGCCKEEPQVVEVEKVVVVHDTLYVQEIEEIEKNFNAAEFIKGKADLSESAKFVLHDLAKVMQKNPQVRLRLEGHTSAEGDAAFNQKLSEQRAQAAVDFMIESEGIDAARLEAVGKGSSEPKNADDPTAPENRRTEFIVLE
ncbi:MAG: OmpA family protein [Paludibacteraceae bacterium]|nr:OmpA family protein [Paludibacteraceae bacterium]